MKVDLKLGKSISSNGRRRCYIIINDVFYVRIIGKLFGELNEYLKGVDKR